MHSLLRTPPKNKMRAPARTPPAEPISRALAAAVARASQSPASERASAAPQRSPAVLDPEPSGVLMPQDRSMDSVAERLTFAAEHVSWPSPPLELPCEEEQRHRSVHTQPISGVLGRTFGSACSPEEVGGAHRHPSSLPAASPSPQASSSGSPASGPQVVAKWVREVKSRRPGSESPGRPSTRSSGWGSAASKHSPAVAGAGDGGGSRPGVESVMEKLLRQMAVDLAEQRGSPGQGSPMPSSQPVAVSPSSGSTVWQQAAPEATLTVPVVVETRRARVSAQPRDSAVQCRLQHEHEAINLMQKVRALESQLERERRQIESLQAEKATAAALLEMAALQVELSSTCSFPSMEVSRRFGPEDTQDNNPGAILVPLLRRALGSEAAAERGTAGLTSLPSVVSSALEHSDDGDGLPADVSDSVESSECNRGFLGSPDDETNMMTWLSNPLADDSNSSGVSTSEDIDLMLSAEANDASRGAPQLPEATGTEHTALRSRIESSANDPPSSIISWAHGTEMQGTSAHGFHAENPLFESCLPDDSSLDTHKRIEMLETHVTGLLDQHSDQISKSEGVVLELVLCAQAKVEELEATLELATGLASAACQAASELSKKLEASEQRLAHSIAPQLPRPEAEASPGSAVSVAALKSELAQALARAEAAEGRLQQVHEAEAKADKAQAAVASANVYVAASDAHLAETPHAALGQTKQRSMCMLPSSGAEVCEARDVARIRRPLRTTPPARSTKQASAFVWGAAGTEDPMRLNNSSSVSGGSDVDEWSHQSIEEGLVKPMKLGELTRTLSTERAALVADLSALRAEVVERSASHRCFSDNDHSS